MTGARSLIRTVDSADLGWVALAAAIGAITAVSAWPRNDGTLAVIEVAAGALACLALLARSAAPVAVAVVATTLAALSPLALAAAILAVAGAAPRCELRTYTWLAVYVVTVAALHGVLYLSHVGGPFGQLTNVVLVVPAVGLGLLGRARLARTESEQARRVAEARAAERRRIAREMHDVLAHRISIVSVHAGALEVHPDASPDDVAEAAGVIRESAHAALGELREVISLLRDDEQPSPGDADPGPSTAGMTRPQPALEDVSRLVQESRHAGMSVELRSRIGGAVAVPDAVERAAYHVVQEGLTNARKHAPGRAVQIGLARDPDGPLIVSVLTSGPAGEPAGPPGRATPPGTGTGLVGLAERVTLAGGRLDHAPTPEGGYTLTATLPVTP